MQTLSIIIPVFNEEKLIEKVLNEVIRADSLGLKKEIIIVDDGSTDNTVKNVKYQMTNDKYSRKNTKLFLIEKSKNEGKGSALKTGFAKATGDILMVQDADNEYSVADYPLLIVPFIKDNADVVYGSRNIMRKSFHTRYSYFLFYIGGILLTWIVNLLYRTFLTDQATGYKLFSKKVKKILLKANENGFSYEVAVTALLAENGYQFRETPIHYSPRTMKDGKKINILDFIKSILVALKYKFTS